MKIAIINSLYKPYTRGGAEVIAELVTQSLRAVGHDVFVITITDDKNQKNPVWDEVEGVRVCRFYPKNIFSFVQINQQPVFKRLIWHLLDMFNWSAARKVKNILREEKPDLVLSHNLKGLSYFLPRAIKSLGIKNIQTIHDIQLSVLSGLMIYGEEKKARWFKLFEFFNRWLWASPDVVVSPSRWLMDFYQQRGFFPESKRVVCPNPVQSPVVPLIKELPQDQINYVIIGQLEEHKGVEFLLEVFKKFITDHPQCHLWLVGRGKELDRLGTLYSNDQQIKFLGYVEHNELPEKVFKFCHYLIMPSLCYENSPTVIYDSFINQTPVIVADIGGSAELVQEGVNGYIFEPGDRLSLLNKLNISYKQIATSQKMGENGNILVKEYSIEKYLAKILSL